MTSSTRESRREASDPLSVALDELYAAPLDSFVARRRELVAKLRASGEVPASRLVGAVGKPTRMAWALNQVAREHPELLRAVFDARDAAVAAPSRGDLESVRAATRSYRERVADVVRAARDSLAAAGVDTATSQAREDARRISETLQAAHAEASAMRERLLAGRLTRDIEVDDPFAGLDVEGDGAHRREPPHVATPASAVTPGATAGGPEGATGRAAAAREAAREKQRELRRHREKEEEEKRERQRAIEVTRRHVTSLEEAARVARKAADESRLAAQRAQAAAERAQSAAAGADDRLERARAELRALER